jgi:DNA primase
MDLEQPKLDTRKAISHRQRTDPLGRQLPPYHLAIANYHLQRMEPTGWDSDDRVLFVLDDNRMYRRTDPPPPPEPQKAKAKPKSKKSRGTRASKRQKVSTPEPEEQAEDETVAQIEQEPAEDEDNGFGGMKWECVCVTLEDYQEYMSSIRKSRDPNEKTLYKRLEEDVIPVMQGLAEEQAKKQARKMKELENMQKLAFAKRSSRISSRLEKQKEQEEVDNAERRRQEELSKAKAEQEKQKKLEEVSNICATSSVLKLTKSRRTILVE